MSVACCLPLPWNNFLASFTIVSRGTFADNVTLPNFDKYDGFLVSVTHFPKGLLDSHKTR